MDNEMQQSRSLIFEAEKAQQRTTTTLTKQDGELEAPLSNLLPVTEFQVQPIPPAMEPSFELSEQPQRNMLPSEPEVNCSPSKEREMASFPSTSEGRLLIGKLLETGPSRNAFKKPAISNVQYKAESHEQVQSEHFNGLQGELHSFEEMHPTQLELESRESMFHEIGSYVPSSIEASHTLLPSETASVVPFSMNADSASQNSQVIRINNEQEPATPITYYQSELVQYDGSLPPNFVYEAQPCRNPPLSAPLVVPQIPFMGRASNIEKSFESPNRRIEESVVYSDHSETESTENLKEPLPPEEFHDNRPKNSPPKYEKQAISEEPIRTPPQQEPGLQGRTMSEQMTLEQPEECTEKQLSSQEESRPSPQHPSIVAEQSQPTSNREEPPIIPPKEVIYTSFHYMPLPYEPPAESQFQHLRYMSREITYRATELGETRYLLDTEQQNWRKILPNIRPAEIEVPKNPYYCFNLPMNMPLQRNLNSRKNAVEAINTAASNRLELLVQMEQRNEALNNRLGQLYVLLEQNMKPSEVLKCELQRRSRANAQAPSVREGALSQLSPEQLYLTLYDAFQQQFNELQTSLLFRQTLRAMSYLYLQIFAKLNISEENLKMEANFEQLVYNKVHSKKENDIIKQPALVRNVTLKPYQIECLRFLVSMYNSNVLHQRATIGKNVQGVSLADDMGLGKTLQTIAFLLYLHEKRMAIGMHLIISPLPVSENWEKEFKSFASNFNIIVYKGVDRERIRQDIIQRSGYYNCIITTYDYIIEDKGFFKKFVFDCVVVDEASRIKNGKSKLISVLRNDIMCRFRLLLSGTPLQNNIRELFTLLEFIHGTVFEDFVKFESVFGKVFQKHQENSSDSEESGDVADTADAADIAEPVNAVDTSVTTNIFDAETEETADTPTTQITQSTESTSEQFSDNEKLFIIYRLHGIIKPYMIRRIKADVLDQLPPKDEIVLRVPLSAFQKYLYQLSLREAGRLIQSESMLNSNNSEALPKSFIRNVDMYLRKVCNHPYLGVEGDQLMLLQHYVLTQAKAFEAHHKNTQTELFLRQETKSKPHCEGAFSNEQAEFPYLQNMYFGDALSRYSGKMQLLSQLLLKLKETNHRVLIFSQFKLILNLLCEFMEYYSYNYLRFDGEVRDSDRNRMVQQFNAPDSKYFVFLLSTRAASHGLNLQSADTVIIYDCDFNAFYDQQAEDRVYRIGETRHVKVIKLYTDTVLEQKILDISSAKLHMARSILDAGELNSGPGSVENEIQQEEQSHMRPEHLPHPNESGHTSESTQQSQTPVNEYWQSMEISRPHFSKREFLLELLRTSDERAPSALMNNRQINRLLARSDAEIALFDQIDAALRDQFVQKYCYGSSVSSPVSVSAETFPLEPQIVDYLIPTVPNVFLESSDALKTLLRAQYAENIPGAAFVAGGFDTTTEPEEKLTIENFSAVEFVGGDIFRKLWRITHSVTDPAEISRETKQQMRTRSVYSNSDSIFLKFARRDAAAALLDEELCINAIELFSGPLMDMYEIEEMADSVIGSFRSFSGFPSKFQLQQSIILLPNSCTVTVNFNAAAMQWQAKNGLKLADGNAPTPLTLNFHLRLLFALHSAFSVSSSRFMLPETTLPLPAAFAMWITEEETSVETAPGVSGTSDATKEKVVQNGINFMGISPEAQTVKAGKPPQDLAGSKTDSVSEELTQNQPQNVQMSLKTVWFRIITLQYSALVEFLADVKLAAKIAIFKAKRSSGVPGMAKKIVEATVEAIRKVFDVDDVDWALKRLSAYDERGRITQTGYELDESDIGSGVAECAEIDDAITKSAVFNISKADESTHQFGSGIYGGGLYEKLIMPLVEYAMVE